MNVLFVALLIVCSNALRLKSFDLVTSYERLEEFRDQEGLVVVEYADSRCPHCQKYRPIYEENAKKSQFKFYSVYMDKVPGNYDEIELFPTVIIYKNGRAVFKKAQPLLSTVNKKLDELLKTE